MPEQDELFKRRMIDLARQAESRSMYTFSGFLGLAEQDMYTRMGKDLGFIDHELYGGSPAAERQIAVFGSEAEFGYPPEYPIAVMSIVPAAEKFAEELNHRDYLGAILNLGIDRSLIGDIVIRGKRAWFYCLDSIADYMAENLTQVRHDTVRCTRASGDIPELTPELKEVSINIASERLDSIVAALTGISRNHVTELFTQQKVSVNGRIVMNYSKGLKEDDVLSVRGFGKAIYAGVTGESRKGRLYVTLKKYV